MSRRLVSLVVGFAAVISLQVGACGGDDDGGSDDGHGEVLENADCQAISDACHHVAGETGRPAECHDIAHEDKAAACKAAVRECVTTCEAAE